MIKKGKELNNERGYVLTPGKTESRWVMRQVNICELSIKTLWFGSLG